MLVAARTGSTRLPCPCDDDAIAGAWGQGKSSVRWGHFHNLSEDAEEEEDSIDLGCNSSGTEMCGRQRQQIKGMRCSLLTRGWWRTPAPELVAGKRSRTARAFPGQVALDRPSGDELLAW